MLDEILGNIGDALAWTIGVPLLVFMFTYAKGSPWRANALGIERMFQKGYLLALWLVIMAGNFLPDELNTFRLVARALIFAAVTTMLTLQIVNLRRVQTDSKRPLFFTWLTYKAAAKRGARRVQR